MVKSEWGTRYTCYKCEALFYDLNKPEPICPKCNANQTKETTKTAAPSPRARARTVMPEEPEAVEESGDDTVKGVDGKEIDQGEAEESA